MQNNNYTENSKTLTLGLASALLTCEAELTTGGGCWDVGGPGAGAVRTGKPEVMPPLLPPYAGKNDQGYNSYQTLIMLYSEFCFGFKYGKTLRKLSKKCSSFLFLFHFFFFLL